MWILTCANTGVIAALVVCQMGKRREVLDWIASLFN